MSSRCTPARRSRVLAVLPLLEKAYGPRPMRSRGKCLDELVHAMLTQNTNMANARAGYRQLRRAFSSWTKVMNAPVDDVQRQIAVCGLARMRARRLQNLLRVIKSRHGKLDLEFLGHQTAEEAFRYLTGFYGIGPKTAAYTLLFSFNMPVFPVDKGIHRASRRLGLVRAKAGEEETGAAIQKMLGRPGLCYSLHVLMFAHAKAVCRPKNPKCRECPLVALCPYGQRRVRHRPPKVMEVPVRRVRPVVLSGFASAGIPKHGDREESRRRAG